MRSNRFLDSGRMVLAAVAAGCSLDAFELNDWLAVDATLAASFQQVIDDGSGAASNSGRGAIPFQLGISATPGERHEFFTRLGFAAGDGLNPVSPFEQATWASDLEADVRDINGRGYGYVLNAWYKLTLAESDRSLALTVGILDSTDYIDTNEFANDEFTQFMNEAFVNSGSYSLTSYDLGFALEGALDHWTANFVAMRIGQLEDGIDSWFTGLQVGYRADSALGQGNYRVGLVATDQPELGLPTEEPDAFLYSGLSLDQQLGSELGAFFRLSWRLQDAAETYRWITSGGLVLDGDRWGRESDTIGLAYAYFEGGDVGVERSQVVELYYRLAVNDTLALTADVQYLADALESGPSPSGWVPGLRTVVQF